MERTVLRSSATRRASAARRRQRRPCKRAFALAGLRFVWESLGIGSEFGFKSKLPMIIHESSARISPADAPPPAIAADVADR